MFEGEKTSLFWIGLLLLSFASVAFFAVLWSILTYAYYPYNNGISYYTITTDVPLIVGASVFIAVGFYMMKSGAKKTQTPKQTAPT